MQAIIANHTGHCHCTIATPRTPPLNARTDPTERSMPAIISTKVMPTAIKTDAGISFAMDVKVVTEKKCAVEKPKTAVKRIRTATRPRQFSRISRVWLFLRTSFPAVTATDGAELVRFLSIDGVFDSGRLNNAEDHHKRFHDLQASPSPE